jgi:hypothetical protein
MKALRSTEYGVPRRSLVERSFSDENGRSYYRCIPGFFTFWGLGPGGCWRLDIPVVSSPRHAVIRWVSICIYNIGSIHYWIQGRGPVFLVLVILRRIIGSEPSSQTQSRWKGLALYSVYPTLYVVTWYSVQGTCSQ